MRLHFPRHVHHPRAIEGVGGVLGEAKLEKRIETIYVTASATGTGKIVGWSTVGATPTSTKKTAATTSKSTVGSAGTTKAQTTLRSSTSSHHSSTSRRLSRTTISSSKTASLVVSVPSTTSTSSSSRIETTTSSVPSSSSSSSSSSSHASSSSTAVLEAVSSSGSSATPIASASSTGTSSGSTGLPSGAVAGLAIAGIFFALIVGAIGFFLYRNRKRQQEALAYEKTEDEKGGARGFAAAAESNPFSNEKAVPVVVRELNPSPEPEPEYYRPSATPSIVSEKAPRVSLRPVTQFQPNLDQMAAIAAAQKEEEEKRKQRSENLKPGAVQRKAPPPRLNLDDEVSPKIMQGPFMTPEPSPTPSMASAFTEASLIEEGTSVVPQPKAMSPVHRVQMDFSPTMDDELGLRVGQLVRILHEYDDSWCLCIRLDRSKQGVCPRTCLSQRPVKPRGRPPIPVTPRTADDVPPSPSGLSARPGPSDFPQPKSSPRQASTDSRPASPSSPYNRPQYRPATPDRSQSPRPQSPSSPSLPPTPTITISPSPEPESPIYESYSPQSPTSTTSSYRPAAAPVRPSPLSKTTTRSSEILPEGSGNQFAHAL